MMQTSKTAVRNGYAHEQRSNSNPGSNNPEAEKKTQEETDKEIANTVERGSATRQKEKAILSVRFHSRERHAGKLIS